jgi:hypothetical protein
MSSPDIIAFLPCLLSYAVVRLSICPYRTRGRNRNTISRRSKKGEIRHAMFFFARGLSNPLIFFFLVDSTNSPDSSFARRKKIDPNMCHQFFHLSTLFVLLQSFRDRRGGRQLVHGPRSISPCLRLAGRNDHFAR